jgi:hypothetical protein
MPMQQPPGRQMQASQQPQMQPYPVTVSGGGTFQNMMQNFGPQMQHWFQGWRPQFGGFMGAPQWRMPISDLAARHAASLGYTNGTGY